MGNKKLLFIFFLFFFVFCISSCSYWFQTGSTHLSILDPEKVYDLEADWKFFIGDPPGAMDPDFQDEDWDTFPVPGYWRYLGIKDVRSAWYRLTVYIGEEYSGEDMGIFVPGIFEAYKIYFNGKLIGREGDFDGAGNWVGSRHRINFFHIPKDFIKTSGSNVISVHVLDNYNFGAITGNFYIGEYSNIKTKFILTFVGSLAVNGFFLIIGIALFLVTVRRREFLSFFLFSLILILSSLIILFLDRVLGWLIEDFMIQNYIFLVSVASITPLYILTSLLYFKVRPGKIGKTLILVSVPILVFILSTGYNESLMHWRNDISLPILHVYGSLTIGYIIYILFKAYKKKNVVGIRWILLGTAILMTNSLWIISRYEDTISENLLSISFLFFFFTVFYAMSLQFIQKLEQEKSREKRYRKKLEEEVERKTKSLVETNRDLESANRMRDHIFAIIGHDLRSPLDTLNLITDLFRNNQITHRDFQIRILEIRDLLKSSRQLLENLLNWASSQLGFVQTQSMEVDLLELCMEVAKIHVPKAGRKEIELKIISKTNPIIQSDPKILSLVLHNLVSNAIKYSYPKSEVLIQLMETDHLVEVSVMDFGIGIPVEEEEFLAATHNYLRNGTANEKSTGIGLQLCKTFLEKINSQLFYSQNGDSGSNFSFYLNLS